MARKIELIRAEDLTSAVREREGITLTTGTIGLELRSGSVIREYKEIKGRFFDFLRGNIKKRV